MLSLILSHFRGFAAGIYTTNSPEACHYVAENCEANVIVVENDQQLQKILKIRDQLPHLKAIVQYSGELKEKYDTVFTVGTLFFSFCWYNRQSKDDTN